MNENDKYCNNCGIKGHLYKDCHNPIMSFGHILFRRDNNKILMIQRKDSLCYIEFLRGKYDIFNINYIQILINKFTNEEKENLIKYEFDNLWKKLWLIDNEEITYQIKNDYIKGKEKYDKLKKGYLYHKTNEYVDFDYFLKKSNTNYISSEWEFPKGRRNNKETNKECAEREFKEETNYNKNDYQLISNITPFSEEYLGENRVRYKHIYYIGYLNNLEKQIKIDTNNINQFTEIKDIQWLTKEESLNKIRNYHHTRRKVIEQIYDLIDNLDKEYILT